MSVRFELYAAGAASPDALWSVVGDLRRLPEWTDADDVEAPDGDPEPGATFVTQLKSGALTWTVDAAGHRLIEATAATPQGRLSVGAKVASDPLGSRLVLAAALQPQGGWRRLRARLVDGPALRRRFDDWCHQALRLAGEGR